jgi:hypothetical protein
VVNALKGLFVSKLASYNRIMSAETPSLSRVEAYRLFYETANLLSQSLIKEYQAEDRLTGAHTGLQAYTDAFSSLSKRQEVMKNLLRVWDFRTIISLVMQYNNAQASISKELNTRKVLEHALYRYAKQMHGRFPLEGIKLVGRDSPQWFAKYLVEPKIPEIKPLSIKNTFPMDKDNPLHYQTRNRVEPLLVIPQEDHQMPKLLIHRGFVLDMGDDRRIALPPTEKPRPIPIHLLLVK